MEKISHLLVNQHHHETMVRSSCFISNKYTSSYVLGPKLLIFGTIIPPFINRESLQMAIKTRTSGLMTIWDMENTGSLDPHIFIHGPSFLAACLVKFRAQDFLPQDGMVGPPMPGWWVGEIPHLGPTWRINPFETLVFFLPPIWKKICAQVKFGSSSPNRDEHKHIWKHQDHQLDLVGG